jgi:hypothetical protein
LADTRLRVAHIGPKNADVYYVKIFLPSKPAFLFKQLLPLVIISGISILLIVCLFPDTYFHYPQTISACVGKGKFYQ